jgi:Flp pilus assembly CpaE family ATPase
VSEQKPAVVLALTPVVERAIEPLLFGPLAVVEPHASVGEADELDHELGPNTEAVLLSPDLSGLTPAHCVRARARGARLVGIALDEDDRQVLGALAVDDTLDADAGADALRRALRDSSVPASAAPAAVTAPTPAPRAGSVVAVIGSKGAPGASESAASLAALASKRWTALLVELDALGGAFDLRLAADAHQGSLLGVARAADAGDSALRELLERWLATREGWPPVLLGPAALTQALPELARPGAVATALAALAAVTPLSVLDVGFQLEQGDEMGAVARIHREALVAADAVLLVLGAREEQLRAGLAQLELLLDTLAIKPERLRVVANGVGGPGAVPTTELTETLAQRLAERGLALDAALPWDGRALAKATRAGLPLAIAHPRGRYARTLTRMLEQLFLPVAPEPRERKHMLIPPAPKKQTEEVALPWRRS